MPALVFRSWTLSYYHLDPNRPGERLARQLEQELGYHVLRRLPAPCEIWCRSMPPPTNTMTLGVLDTETTGLDANRHKMIELAVAKLTIDLDDGVVADVEGPVSWLEDPGEPLTPEIEALTGISDGDVRGQAFDEVEIARILDDVDLLVAHNAPFDLGFFRQRFPNLGHPWACSASEIDWPAHGFIGARSIAALITAAGHFLPDAHRAGPDAWATTCLLAHPGNDDRAIAAHLIAVAKRPTMRLYASGAPFSVKDTLKAAGYRWSSSRRAWWVEGDTEQVGNEVAWLAGIYQAIRPGIEKVDWYNRHAS